jgi:mycothiol synthase
MSSSLLRQLREEDAEQVAALFVESFGSMRHVDAEEVRSWLRNEELKPELLRVLELDGRVVGYGDLWIEDDEVALDATAPGHWQLFFEWAEERARQDGVRARALFPAGHELAGIVAARGYRLWRSSFTMEIDAVDSLPPVLPDGFVQRSYRPQDEEQLIAALNETFVDDPFFRDISPSNFREFYLRARGYDPALWLLAWDGDELAGFALAYVGRGGDLDLGWVGTLGVRAPWRRRGLGEALLRAALHELNARGLSRIGLGVDAENATGAVSLYERVGMHVAQQNDNWVLEP